MNEQELLDDIFESIDAMMSQDGFKPLNMFLRVLSPDGDLSIVIAILTATIPGKHFLPARAEFFRAVQARPDVDDQLLYGLD